MEGIILSGLSNYKKDFRSTSDNKSRFKITYSFHTTLISTSVHYSRNYMDCTEKTGFAEYEDYFPPGPYQNARE